MGQGTGSEAGLVPGPGPAGGRHSPLRSQTGLFQGSGAVQGGLQPRPDRWSDQTRGLQTCAPGD